MGFDRKKKKEHIVATALRALYYGKLKLKLMKSQVSSRLIV